MSESAASRRIEDIADVAVGELRPHPDNPRKISRERLAQLKRSLEADPDLLRARPLIALRDGTVIAGNQRLRAAVELGWPSVPVVYADVDEQTARLWMLRDNNSFGDWDERPLAEMLAGLAEGGVELALAGFEGATVDGLLAGLEAERARPEPDHAPPVPSTPRSKPGKVYELGPHRLACGDATQAATRDAALGGERVSAVWTDPPYGIAYKALRRDDAISGDEDFATAADLLVSALDGVAAESAFVCCDWRSLGTISDAMLRAWFPPKACIVWDKQRGVQNLDRFHKRHELILYAGPYGGQPTVDGDVWAIARDFDPDHPTPKPVELIERALAAATAAGDVVYDPFAGSGSTMIAADKLGRRAYMVELDPGYCDVIRDRWEAWNADQV